MKIQKKYSNPMLRLSFWGVSLLALISCGGGDSGSPSNTANTVVTTQSTTNNNPSGCETTPDQNDTDAPTAEILFPWHLAKVTRDTITVSGIAYDDSGIVSLSVNGVEAEVDCTPIVANGKQSTQAGFAWHAEIILNKVSHNEIVVKVTDGSGNVKNNADEVHLTWELDGFVPTSFVFDVNHNRVIGTIWASEIAELNLTTGEARSISTFDKGYYGGFVLDGNSLYHTAFDYDNPSNMFIYSTDIVSGQVSTIESVDVSLPDNAFSSVQQLAFDPVDKVFYFLVVFYLLDTNSNQYHIFQYNLNTQVFSLLSSSEQDQGELLSTGDMVFNGDELLVFANDIGNYDNGIISVDLQSGFRHKISSLSNLNSMSLAVNPSGDTAYATGFDGVEKVNLATGDRENISPESQEDLYYFAQPQSTAVDIANEQLLVGEEGLDMIIGVNTITGVRSAVYDNGIGSGHKMIRPGNIVLDEENQRAFVVDDGFNTIRVLLSVDLVSGNRTRIADLSQVIDYIIDGLAFDKERNRVLLAFDDKILEVDLETGNISTFSDAMHGSGIEFVAISDLVIDPDHNRLLVSDYGLDAVIAVNLDNGDRTIVSQANVKGDGDTFEGASTITVDFSNQIAYVGSQYLGVIFSVNLETGDRNIALNECLNDYGQNILVLGAGGIFKISFNPYSRELLIPTTNIGIYDVDKAVCSVQGIGEGDVLDLSYTSRGQILATTFRKLLQINLTDGESVWISK